MTTRTRRRVYLVRHGDVSYFGPDRSSVHPDLVPLNDEGRRQAQSTAQLLADAPLDRVAVSPLARCRQTAEILLGTRDLPVTVCEELREIRPGTFINLPFEELERVIGGAFAGPLQADTRFLMGETFGSLVDRVLPCMQRLLDDPGWRHLLIVAHGGVNRVILTAALGTGIVGFGHIEQDPACLNIVDVDDGGDYVVRLMNYTAYNPLKVGWERTTMERLYDEFARLYGPGGDKA